MERRFITVRGKREEVPENVVNLDTWKKYRRNWVDYENNPKRYYTFESGRKVKLPNPSLELFCKKNGISLREQKLAQKQANEMRKIQASLGNLKKLSFVASGLSVAFIKNASQLSKENETLMLELFGRFWNARQVHKKLSENGVKISYEAVNIFFNKNREKIREIRNATQESIDDLSVGIKRSRLETLDFLLADLKELYPNQSPMNKIPYSKEIRGIIEQARKEVEGDELKLTVNGRIDINATIEVSMRNSNMLMDFTIIQMVMSRVAARTGIPYMRIVTRLANSFYSKFNGFRKNENLQETPIYPSSFNYDIFEMKPVIDELYRIEDSSYTVEEKPLEEEVQVKREFDKSLLQELLSKQLEKLKDSKENLL